MTEFQLNAKRYSLAKESVGMGEVVWSDNLISITDAMDILRSLPPRCDEDYIAPDEYLKDRLKFLREEHEELESDMRQSMCQARVDQLIAETIGGTDER